MTWLIAGLLGCPAPTQDPEPLDCTGITWATHAGPYVGRWCLDCHHSALGPDDRSGAPIGLDFDQTDEVITWSQSMAAVTTGPSPVMPPGGGPGADERRRFGEWVTCGAPAPGPEDRCAGETWHGDLAASTAPIDLCPATRWVTGDLLLDGPHGPLACVCGVGGDLRLRTSGEAHVDLPELTSVVGELEVSDNPHLRTLGLAALRRAGRVRVNHNVQLTGLPVGALEAVDGSIQVTGNPELVGVDLHALTSVGGVVDFSDNAGLRWILPPAGLVELPDGLDLSDTPAFGDLEGWDALERVGALRVERSGARAVRGFPSLRQTGSVHLVQLDRVEEIDAFSAMELVDGSFWLSRFGPFDRFRGFGAVREVRGAVVVERVEGLTSMGLESLERVEGGLQFAENDDLRDLLALTGLTHVGALSILNQAVLADLEGLHGLSAIAGDVRIEGNTDLADLGGLRHLAVIGGELRVEHNPALLGPEGLASLVEVGGDVTFAHNGFDASVAAAFLAGVQVGGLVVLE